MLTCEASWNTTTNFITRASNLIKSSPRCNHITLDSSKKNSGRVVARYAATVEHQPGGAITELIASTAIGLCWGRERSYSVRQTTWSVYGKPRRCGYCFL